MIYTVLRYVCVSLLVLCPVRATVIALMYGKDGIWAAADTKLQNVPAVPYGCKVYAREAMIIVVGGQYLFEFPSLNLGHVFQRSYGRTPLAIVDSTARLIQDGLNATTNTVIQQRFQFAVAFIGWYTDGKPQLRELVVKRNDGPAFGATATIYTPAQDAKNCTVAPVGGFDGGCIFDPNSDPATSRGILQLLSSVSPLERLRSLILKQSQRHPNKVGTASTIFHMTSTGEQGFIQNCPTAKE